MTSPAATDEALLGARDAASFAAFYHRYAETVLGFFSRRTRDAELAADLTAETFAAALAGPAALPAARPAPASAWLFGIAMHKLADAQRRGYAERRAVPAAGDGAPRARRRGHRAYRRAGRERPRERPAGAAGRRPAGRDPGARGRRAVLRATSRHEEQVSEAVVRKRVSRGLAAVRARMGARR